MVCFEFRSCVILHLLGFLICKLSNQLASFFLHLSLVLSSFFFFGWGITTRVYSLCMQEFLHKSENASTWWVWSQKTRFELFHGQSQNQCALNILWKGYLVDIGAKYWTSNKISTSYMDKEGKVSTIVFRSPKMVCLTAFARMMSVMLTSCIGGHW